MKRDLPSAAAPAAAHNVQDTHDAQAAAKSAGLRYVHDHQPGIARQGIPHHRQDDVDEQCREPVHRACLQPQRAQKEHGQQRHSGTGADTGCTRPAMNGPRGLAHGCV